MASKERVRESIGVPVGSVGPIGLENVFLIADKEVMGLSETVIGANREDYHYTGVQPGIDFEPDLIEDVIVIQEGDNCIRCGLPLVKGKGISLGYITEEGFEVSKDGVL